MSPLITVFTPWLVIPALPPEVPHLEAGPSAVAAGRALAGAAPVPTPGGGVPSKPRIGSCPPPQAASAPSTHAASHGLMLLLKLFMVFPVECEAGADRRRFASTQQVALLLSF